MPLSMYCTSIFTNPQLAKYAYVDYWSIWYNKRSLDMNVDYPSLSHTNILYMYDGGNQPSDSLVIFIFCVFLANGFSMQWIAWYD